MDQRRYLPAKSELYPEDCKADTRQLIELAADGKGFTAVETRRLNKSGKVIDVSISAAIWRDLSGKPVGSVVTLRDIT